jgi:hypothetical protein
MLFGDAVVGLFAAGLVVFFLLPGSRSLYESAYNAAPILLSFIKFALLATGGEWIARRIKERSYALMGFGLLPKSIIWGVLGIFIYWAFLIFGNGVAAAFLSLQSAETFGGRLLLAFLTSLFMNLIFSPVLMLTHHLTDNHIKLNNGCFPVKGQSILSLLTTIDWQRMWGFVFKKTIPFFWIPAHTITFLLPSQYRVLYAALLSVALGILLGVAGKHSLAQKQ